MTKNKSRTLRLDTQTVRVLDADQLRHAAGGTLLVYNLGYSNYFTGAYQQLGSLPPSTSVSSY